MTDIELPESIIEKSDTNSKLERIFRVPYKRLLKAKKGIKSMKYHGLAHKHSKEEILRQIKEADAAVSSALATLEIELKKEGINPSSLQDLRKAHQKYFDCSIQVKDWVISRNNTIIDLIMVE